MILEDIGEGDDALLCVTDQPACCRPPYYNGAIGNWFFPNGTRVPSSVSQWDFHRIRGQSAISLQSRRGGMNGIYSCVIPDAMNVTRTILIGVYTAETGEWYTCYIHFCSVKLYRFTRNCGCHYAKLHSYRGVCMYRKLPTLLLCGYWVIIQWNSFVWLWFISHLTAGTEYYTQPTDSNVTDLSNYRPISYQKRCTDYFCLILHIYVSSVDLAYIHG